MSIERLYYTDAYVRTFDARVVTCAPVAGSSDDARYAVRLDSSAFYPTSGGQPFDTGTLGPAHVLDVIDDADGAVTHIVDAPLESGTTVTGTIDWTRRFDHMQQHTGQHVLSAAFDALFDNRTESFHLGADTCSIDLAKEVTAHDIAAAVDEANRVVWEDRLVTVRFVSPEEAAGLPLRKEPAREGPLRLVQVADFDLSACGGTHVARTGGIGIIVVSGWERFRGGSRVQFLCGGRVRQRFDLWRDALQSTMKHLSVAPQELAGAIERLQGENKQAARALRTAQERLAVVDAQALVERAPLAGDRRVVVESIADADASILKALAAAAASHAGVAVALFSAVPPSLVVVARHSDVTVDAGAVVKALVGRFGGKGGGKPDLAQGGGLTGSTEDLRAAARELLAR
ncbi:MAG: alanyl-tRNA editing protein [Acidobacteria bacterium]|nr:alanyl-tRNA editing protein [Acidobacteriota bacterium]